jgi:HSP20 family protein
MSILIPTSKKESNKTMDSNFNGLPTLPSWFDDILGKGFTSEYLSNFNTGITLPAVNVIESNDEFILEMAVPGFKKSDFQVNIDNNILSISAEIDSENNQTAGNYTRREFGYATFKRTFDIPETVETDHIFAKYNDGILKITLPKRDEAKKKPVKTIQIG